VHETTTFLLVTLPNIHRFKKKFTYTLSNKPFLLWLLTTPPHLKYVATLPCNLSLMACFADIDVSRGSVATYARCGGMFNIHLTTNSLRNLPVKNFVNRLRFDKIMVMSLWPRFLAHPLFLIYFCIYFYDFLQTSYLNIYQTDLRQICRICRTVVVDEQSEVSF